MDCSNYKELSGLRPEDLLEEERQQLNDHLAHCDPCRREQHADEEILALVDSWPDLQSAITAEDIRGLDGLETVAAVPGASVSRAAEPSAVITPPQRRGSRLVPIAVALAAMVLLCMTLVPRMLQDEPAPTHRLKGATADVIEPITLDLQLSVETSLGETTMLSPGQESGSYGPTEGLLFGVRTDGPGTLVLAEQTPDGALHMLGPGDASTWSRGQEGNLALVDGAGRRLAYQPDAGSGSYRFTALLIEPATEEAALSDVESLIRGDEVSGISLLAMDSFTIEWSAGVDGDLAH